MLRLKLIALLGAVLLIAGAGGGVVAQSSRWVEKGSGPHCVARALTEEEAAAGVPSEVECFDTFEEALRSIHADPEDFSAGSVAATNAPAPAGADGVADASPRAARGEHCVVRIEPLRPGENASAMSGATCFDTFSDAIYAATGGAVRLAPTVAPAELTQEMLKPLSHETVIGIDYRDSNFSGQTLVYAAANTVGCNTGFTYALPTMPSGWNDAVSSARAFGGCTYFRHYEHTYYGGAKLDCTCSTMGVMNDKTSSLKWSRVPPTP